MNVRELIKELEEIDENHHEARVEVCGADGIWELQEVETSNSGTVRFF